MSIDEKAKLGYYNKFNPTKDGKPQFHPDGKEIVTPELVQGWIENGVVTKPSLVKVLREKHLGGVDESVKFLMENMGGIRDEG